MSIVSGHLLPGPVIGGQAYRLHPSRHCEIRLSLTQLCGVNKSPLQLLGSVQCAPHSFGVNSPPHRGLGIEAWLHRDAAMMPPTASQRRPVIVFCASSFPSWSSLQRKRLSQAKNRFRDHCPPAREYQLPLSNVVTFK